MATLIHRIARPTDIQAYVKANAPSYLKATPMDSWRAYLTSLGGTGKTIGDLERSATLPALSSGSTQKEKIRNTYK